MNPLSPARSRLPRLSLPVANALRAWWCLTLLAVGAPIARAEMGFQVPAQCGDQTALLEQLSALSPVAEPTAQLSELSVDIHAATDELFELTLRFRVRAGALRTRTVTDTNCRALLRMAAVGLALALNEEAKPNAPAPAPDATPAAAIPTAAAQARDGEPIPALARPPDSRRDRALEAWLSAEPALAFAVLPESAFGAGGSLFVRTRSVRVRAGASYFLPREGAALPASQLRANLTAGHVGLGWEAVDRPHGALVLMTQGALGMMGAAGRDVPEPSRSRALWSALMLGLLGEVALGTRLRAGASALAQYTLLRARFELADGARVFTTPRWSAIVQLSLSVRFL